MMRASDTLADSRVQKPKNFLAFFSRLLPPPLRREAEKEMKRKFLVLLRRLHVCIILHSCNTMQVNYHITMSSGKKLGGNLRKWRLKKDMSQGDLATALNVDRAYISNIENGRMNPTLSTLEKIANALGISSSELLK